MIVTVWVPSSCAGNSIANVPSEATVPVAIVSPFAFVITTLEPASPVPVIVGVLSFVSWVSLVSTIVSPTVPDVRLARASSCANI